MFMNCAIKMESPVNNMMIHSTYSPNHGKHQPVLAKKSIPASMAITSPSPNISLHSQTLSSTSSTSSSASTTSPELLRCKRRINFGGLGYSLPQTPPQTVARRNERERNRVKMVNLGFATLRQHVPNGAKNKKMSKVDTLRGAVEYIRELKELLGETSSSSDEVCSNGQCPNTSQRQSTSSDENWNPSSVTSLSPTGTSMSTSSITSYNCTIPTNPSQTMLRQHTSCSPRSQLENNSPSPSMGSDASSPYDSLDSMERQVSPEEDDLFDFTNWFS